MSDKMCTVLHCGRFRVNSNAEVHMAPNILRTRTVYSWGPVELFEPARQAVSFIISILKNIHNIYIFSIILND